MQQQTPASDSLVPSTSFAGVMTALAEAQKEQQRAWLDRLQDDVATFSYRRGYETHARYRADDSSQVQASVPRAEAAGGPVSKPGNVAEPGAPRAAAEIGSGDPFQGAQAGFQKRDPVRKTASVTLRMSRAECDRLQRRAGEAGLTVSAYLRSCAFEVDSLRAQVKETLAQLRSARPWWLRLIRPRA